MISEILKIIPKLDSSALAKMEKDLGSRFGRVAKKFGQSIGNLFKGGGIAGAALALIDKILNPLKEVQEAMDRTLASSGDLVDNAGQFGTTAGRLFKLQQLAKSKGLDEDALYTLIQKFQTSVAEAQNDPNKPSAVRNFTGYTDMATGFFDFIQSLQKLEKSQQIAVQQEVFGEKQILKMAGFLQTNFAEQTKLIGAMSGDKYTKALEKLDGLGDLADVLEARRTLNDRLDKAAVMNEGMIRAKDKAERQNLERENSRIKAYENLQAITQTVDKIMGLIEEGLNQLGSLIKWITPTVNRLVDAVEKFSKGPVARGIMKFFGKGD